MRLLLDTHVLLAILAQRTDGLAVAMQRLLVDSTAEFHVSAAGLWEIAIKWRLGKLQLTASLDMLPKLIRGIGAEILVINEHHVLAAVQPEPLTRDPFDRLLLAQCQIERLRLVTVDRALVSHAMAAKL